LYYLTIATDGGAGARANPDDDDDDDDDDDIYNCTGNYFNGRERYRSEFDDALDNYLKRLLHGQTALFELVKFHYTDWTNRSALYEYQRGDVSFTKYT